MLNREPMGMKHLAIKPVKRTVISVSVLNREPMGMKRVGASQTMLVKVLFQCSTASRWG